MSEVTKAKPSEVKAAKAQEVRIINGREYRVVHVPEDTAATARAMRSNRWVKRGIQKSNAATRTSRTEAQALRTIEKKVKKK